MSNRIRARYLAATSVLALLLVSPSSFAERDATPSCETRSRTFATELATVYALSTCYAARSADEDREYFAAIMRAADGFVFVVGAGNQGADRVSLRIKRLKGEAFVALWHTHGAHGLHRELFSPTDTALVEQMRVPFYLADPYGSVRVFRPGDDARAFKDRRSTQRPPRGAAEGTALPADIDAAVPSLALRDR